MTRAPVARGARLQAQGKINLSLRVLARAVDGYHQLETLFQRIALADGVSLTITNGARSLDMLVPGGGAVTLPVERNLAWRAALAYERHANWPVGWHIEIEKRIPMGGGLGGGSANAGAILRLLDRLNPAPLGPKVLLRIATEVGADVPFLTATVPLALGWGRGERLLALPTLPSRSVALLLFPFGISTAEAFGWLAESRAGAEAGAELRADAVALPGAEAAAGGATHAREAFLPPAELLDPTRLGSWSGIADFAINELEPPVFANHPELAAGLERLVSAVAGSGQAHPDVATHVSADESATAPESGQAARGTLGRMTGTGSTLFALRVDRPAEPLLVGPGTEWPGGGRLELTETAPRVEEVELIE